MIGGTPCGFDGRARGLFGGPCFLAAGHRCVPSCIQPGSISNIRKPASFIGFLLHRPAHAAQCRTAASSPRAHPEPRRVAGAHHAVLQSEAAVGHVAGEVEAPVEVEVAGRR